MNFRMTKRGVAALGIAASLAGCSERYIVAADDEVLVVVDGLKTGGDESEATVHYVLARPQALSEADGARVVAMDYKARFRCSDGAWGHSAQTLTTEAGETVSNTQPQPAMETPTVGSLAAHVVSAVCDPAVRAEAATRRPLKSITRDYLETVE